MRNPESSNQGIFEPGKNLRTTSFGKILRKTKLDELPQLVNVLMGNMSFVGPRPEVEKWVNVYPEKWTKVLSVRPGITDNASLVFRNEEEILSLSADPEKLYKETILPKKLELYEDYIANRSLYMDIKLVFKTFSAIFTSTKKIT
jgi:lipopolysaccharide/colanic/teichoic acid biosynthesis glycosyltransferase